jgi:hypothetical protein
LGEREGQIQMANGKRQMAKGFPFLKWQIAKHLNFAVCHLPFDLLLLSRSPGQN